MVEERKEAPGLGQPQDDKVLQMNMMMLSMQNHVGSMTGEDITKKA